MFKKIGSAEPKYLAATDLLIGDMSSVIYEFLLFDRPVVLLANKWVKRNFPDVGPKTDLDNLKNMIEMSLQNPNDYKDSRKYWLEKTISIEENKASERYIDLILEKSMIKKPQFIFVTGNNAVRKTNIKPLIEEVKLRSIKYSLVGRKSDIVYNDYGSNIIIGAHFVDLPTSTLGYKVHIDHDLKGAAATNLACAIRDYKKHNYFPYVDLHIVAGDVGNRRTKLVLGPFANRTVVGGYPKADDLLAFCYNNVKEEVCNELGFDPSKPIVTYAPAGNKKYLKPGGSLSNSVLQKMKEIGEKTDDYNILVKVKYKSNTVLKEFVYDKLRGIYSTYRFLRYSDGGEEWNKIIQDILNEKESQINNL